MSRARQSRSGDGKRPAAPSVCGGPAARSTRLLTPGDERFLIVRTMIARCAPGLRTTSPTIGWHRLVGTSEGIIIVRTRHGRWSAPPDSAVWVPSREHAELETCAQTSLRTLYIRESRAAWCAGDVPGESRSIAVGPLLRELASRVAQLGQLDRRVAWHTSLATLLLHEVRSSAREPHGLLWPTDPRAARVASLVQAEPGDARTLAELCRGQGASVRTVQRLFPVETGLTFDRWRARVRFLHASRLLAEGCKVADAAGACGYQSVSAFVAAFGKEAGVTPGVFCANAASSPG